MDLSTIQEGSIILAPSYLHTSLRLQLLQHKSGIGNIMITSFSSYFSKEQEDIVFTYYQILKEKAHTFTYHQQNCTRIAFIQELVTLIKQLKEENIAIDSLPSSNAFLMELKTIVTLLYPIQIQSEYMMQQIHTLQDASNIYIVDTLTSLQEEKMYHVLLNKGATRLQDITTLQSKEMFHALNKRQEVESCCQYIVDHQIEAADIRITLLDTSYISYIHMFFTRYQIPYHIIQEKEVNPVLSKYLTLLQYYLQPNTQTSCALLLQHVILHPYAKECITFMQLYDLDFTHFIHINYSQTMDSIAYPEMKYIQSLEGKAWEVKQCVEEALDTLLMKQGIDVLYAIDQIICEQHTFTNKEDRKTLFQIRKSYPSMVACMKDKEDLSFYVSYIKQQATPIQKELQGVSISTLQKATLATPYHIVLGATQSNYPAFSGLQGIFDENYFSSLAYPSQQTRYEHYSKQAQNSILACEHLVVFYCLSTLEGKAQEASLEMEVLVHEKATAYPLLQTHQKTKRHYTLEEKEAIALFTKDHVVRGSISSLERYVKCPYAYFLRYGLQLYDPIDVRFNVAKAGSLAHSVLETMSNLYGKQYPYREALEIQSFIEEKIQEMVTLYPNQQQYFKQHTPRMVNYIMSNLAFLSDHEAHSSLSPYANEYHFEHNIDVYNGYTLQLHGIIDRIDTSDFHFRVIDFKSSTKTLVEKDVFNGTSLQLVTYTSIVEEILNKRPLGCFYYSLALPNTNMSYAKVSKRPLALQFTNTDNMFTTLLKNKKMKGWVYHEAISLCDDNGQHTNGVSQLKDGTISARTIYHAKSLSKEIHTMYQEIATQIIGGAIGCTPSEGACLYCSFASICKNANNVCKKEPRIISNEDLYLKGGKRNA